MALCKRGVRFGANTLAQVTALSAHGGANSGGYFATKFSKLNAFSSLPSNRYFYGNLTLRQARVVTNTFTLAKTLEAEGMPSNQANAVTFAIAKAATDIIDMNDEANSSASEAKMQEAKLLIDREFEKVHCEIEKLRIEWRVEMQEMSHRFKADLQAAQWDNLKYLITIFSISAVTVGSILA